jgi:hypothetical protein
MSRTLNRPHRVKPSAFPRAVRGMAAVLLVAFAWAAIRGGAGSLPWLANLAELLGFARGHGPRLFAGTLIALAAMIVLAPSWSRRVAFVAAGMMVFAGTATVSAIRATRLAGPDGPGLSGLEALLAAGVALAAVATGAFLAIRAYRSSTPKSRGLGVSWRIAASFAALGGGLAVAAPPAAVRPALPRPEPFTAPRAEALPPVESIDLDVAAWKGLPLAETPIALHLTGLSDLVGDDPAYLVLYSGRCGTCHELFRERFSGDLPRRTIAIEMPPAADAILAAGDGLEEIDCPACERLSLPAGPRWLARPPTVVRIDAGIVSCVDDASNGSCFEVSP